MRSVICFVPINVWDISGSENVVNEFPLPIQVVKEGHDAIVECAGSDRALIDSTAVIRHATVWLLGRRQDERPAVLDFEMIYLEYDRLFEFLFNRHSQLIKNGFPLRRTLFGSVNLAIEPLR